MEDISSVTRLWLLLSCSWACMFVHVFEYFHCPWQRQNCGSSEAFFSLIYSTSPAVFPCIALPEGSHRNPSSTEKNPGSRMSNHRETNMKRCPCFPAHQHGCFMWSWHLWCGSPKEQKDIQESAIHSAHFNSLTVANHYEPCQPTECEESWEGVVTLFNFAGSLSSGSGCPEGLHSWTVNPGASVATVLNLQCDLLAVALQPERSGSFLGVWKGPVPPRPNHNNNFVGEIVRFRVKTNFPVQLQSQNAFESLLLENIREIKPRINVFRWSRQICMKNNHSHISCVHATLFLFSPSSPPKSCAQPILFLGFNPGTLMSTHH